MAAITLTPNMLHCVRTGLPLGRIPEQLDTVNQALTSGKYTAGMHVGHIRASDTTIEALKAKGVSLKRYWWATDTAKRIAAHNEATLNQHGFTADPSTKTKGQLPNRQYGVYAAPQPKVVQPNEVIDLLSGMAIVPDVDKSTLQPEPVKPPAIVMPKAPAWMDKPSTTVLPTTTELTTKGSSGWATYRSRAMRAGMEKSTISAAWKGARSKMAQPKAVEPCDTGCDTCDEPVVKAQPKAVQPSTNAGNTIRVDANALAATLATLNGAKIVSNEGTEFTVQYVA